MNAEQTTGRVWNRRRTEKQRRLAEANMPDKVIPTDQLVSVLENLLAPGDRVVLVINPPKPPVLIFLFWQDTDLHQYIYRSRITTTLALMIDR